MKPIIGITLDSEKIGGYSKWYPWYAIRQNYAEAIAENGGTPIFLPHEPGLAKQYFDMIDGLIISGGDFDIDPKLYGARKKHPTVKTNNSRTKFEMAIAKLALAENKPMLGICGGEQLINVLLGGTLIQHIPDIIKDSVHQQKTPREKPAHKVTIRKSTMLEKIVASNIMQVNSTHHQAVEKPGKNVVVNSVAPDGIIEGIEYTKHRFCLGVQWHPEYRPDPQKKDNKIFKALIKAAAK